MTGRKATCPTCGRDVLPERGAVCPYCPSGREATPCEPHPLSGWCYVHDHDPAETTPWRCRHGWHSWAFESMGEPRMIEVHQHSSWICELVQRCRRCGVRWTKHSADVPKRVKP